ncbi:MAG: serine/threonine-protein kinase [Pirellulaceae bacterium]
MPTSFFSKLTDVFKDRRVDLGERFQLVREAVYGTMSNFHMAIDRTNNKTVGLKILDPEKTAAFEARFKGLKKPPEGQIALLLKHERIVETYETGLSKDGKPFIVMEFVEGSGLNTLIYNRDAVLNGKRHALFRQMTQALDAVHKAGFIHRDVCPRNFIVAPDGASLKLIDFGLTIPKTRQYMLPGNRTGTPLFMSPEIVRRKPTDERVDLFSLGVSVYQMWAFDFPWPASDTTGRGALQHDSAPPAPIDGKVPGINRLAAKTIMQCLAPDPNNRPASAQEVLRLIKTVASDD